MYHPDRFRITNLSPQSPYHVSCGLHNHRLWLLDSGKTPLYCAQDFAEIGRPTAQKPMDIRDPEVVDPNGMMGFLALVAELEWDHLSSDYCSTVIYPAQSSTTVPAVTDSGRPMTLEPMSCYGSEPLRSVQWITPKGEGQFYLLESQAVPCGVGNAFSQQPPEHRQRIRFTARDNARWEAMVPIVETVCTPQRPCRRINCVEDAGKEVSNAVSFTGNLWSSEWQDKDGRVLNMFFGFARSSDVSLSKAKLYFLRVLETGLPMVYGGLHLA
ncbi:hypothetical protein B0H67DRAFT_75276 [Lasiosphaeris hirsuta]|uniref:Uncharacterized protein n=1 Tax=Lasiosphaeris hirsuta TaxID=260670 RepID=A0AA40BC02_9PEZI|nr:hypothetical protein B0H67DRAFT_75276 [Lasiosphaeris hirsuta]